jgi:hypothetical protein
MMHKGVMVEGWNASLLRKEAVVEGWNSSLLNGGVVEGWKCGSSMVELLRAAGRN